MLRDELEAYHLQRFFILGLVESGYEPDARELMDFKVDENGTPSSTATRIDRLREETNAGRKDYFFPNGTLEKTLLEAGIDITVIPPELSEGLASQS